MSANGSGCVAFRRDVFTYLDGELGEVDRARLEAHRRGCEPCGRFLEVERYWARAVKAGLRRRTAPAALRAEVRRSLDAAATGRSAWLSRRRLVPSLTLAAALLVVAAILVPVWQEGGRDAEDWLQVTDLSGMIVDLECDSLGLSVDQQKRCRNEHVNGLKRGERRYYRFVDSGPAREIIRDPSVRGRSVLVSGGVRDGAGFTTLRVDALRWDGAGELL